jgi:hypothetical protein
LLRAGADVVSHCARRPAKGCAASRTTVLCLGLPRPALPCELSTSLRLRRLGHVFECQSASTSCVDCGAPAQAPRLPAPLLCASGCRGPLFAENLARRSAPPSRSRICDHKSPERVAVAVAPLRRLRGIPHDCSMPLFAHLDSLVGLRVPATMRTRAARVACCSSRPEVGRTRLSSCVLMRHSSLVMAYLGSDGMPVKVAAASGPLPATIDTWVRIRSGQDHFRPWSPGAVQQRLEDFRQVSGNAPRARPYHTR